MLNNFFNMMNPQMQNNIQSIQQQAMQSGNPQQFLMQKSNLYIIAINLCGDTLWVIHLHDA